MDNFCHLALAGAGSGREDGKTREAQAAATRPAFLEVLAKGEASRVPETSQAIQPPQPATKPAACVWEQGWQLWQREQRQPAAPATAPATPYADLPPGAVPAPAATPQDAKELFAKASPAVVRVVVRDQDFKVIGQGSGFFVTADGLLATNYHVIEGADFATIVLAGNETLFVEGVAGVDADADVALLKVTGKDFHHLPLDPGPLPTVGTRVYAIGNPGGLTNTLSEGLVSGLRQVKDGLSIIQTTAAISPGSSGGPLLTADGKAVGVTKSFLAEGQNLNFAVPAGQVRRLLGAQAPLRPLASAGGQRLNKQATDELDKAFEAIDRSDWRTATDILTKLRKSEPDNPVVWFALGYLHGRLKNYDIAVQHYKQAIALRPDYAAAYRWCGVAYLGLNQYKEATASFGQYLTLSPGDIEGYTRIGLLCNGSVPDLEIEAAGTGAPRNQEMRALRATATAAFRKATTVPRKTNADYDYARLAYANLGEDREAIRVCKEWTEARPENAAPYAHLAGIYDSLNQPDEAMKVLERALAKFKDKASIYEDIGKHFERLNQWTKAAEAYEKAISIAGADWSGYVCLDLAGVYGKLGRHDAAIEMCKKATAKVKTDVTYCHLGDACAAAGRYKEAAEAYAAAVPLADGLFAGIAYCGLGEAHRRMSNFDEALTAYTKAIELGMTGPAYLHLGDTYRALGRREEALAAYGKAAAQSYAPEIAKQARQGIAKLQQEHTGGR